MRSKEELKKLIITEEEFVQFTPRMLLALSFRCTERIQPLFPDNNSKTRSTKAFGDPSLMTREFCAGKVKNFIDLWNSFYFVIRNEKGTRSRSRPGLYYYSSTTHTLLNPIFAAYSFLPGEFIKNKTNHHPLQIPDGYDRLEFLVYPHQETGNKQSIKLIFELINYVIKRVEAASVTYEYCTKSSIISRTNREARGFSNDDLQQMDLFLQEKHKMPELIRSEIRKDYESLLANRHSLLDENDPLGAPIDFDTTNLFGPLWQNDPPLWFKS